METNEEILEKMKQVLGSELTSIEICPTHITPILNGVSLGEVPYEYRDGVYTPLLNPSVLNKLKWEHVYFSMMENIKHSVSVFDPKYKDIRLDTWGHLYLREAETDEPVLVRCIYDGREWQVSKVA